MSDAEHIHTCSYECERPACIKAQRDELARWALSIQKTCEDVPEPAACSPGDFAVDVPLCLLSEAKAYAAACVAADRQERK